MQLHLRNIGTIAGIILIAFVAYSIYFASRTLPNTYFGQRHIGNINERKARELISEDIDKYLLTSIDFIAGDSRIAAMPTELGVEYDKEATYRQVNNKGVLRFGRNQVKPAYFINYPKLASYLDVRLGGIETPAQDATAVLADNGFELKSARVGKVVDRSLLYNNLKLRFEELSSEPVKLDLVDNAPNVSDVQLRAVVEVVNKAKNSKVAFTFKDDRWTFDFSDVADAVVFKEEGKEYGSLLNLGFTSEGTSLVDYKYNGQGERKLVFDFDPNKLKILIDPINKAVSRKRADATLRFEGGRVYEFTPAVDGQKLEVDEMAADLHKFLGQNQSPILAFQLPVVVDKARIANEEVNSLGIKELIAHGVSYFAGSIPNRIFNVSLGTSRVTGTIIGPGGVFSFNRSVGEVSGATGYRQAYVISEGRTVLDDGGGICQVSTTVFRAALNGGFPIVARTAHAYRVGYYEQGGFKPGLDATVWAPSVDLQFKNDTGHHILIQATVDSVRLKLDVDIYGTGDGRQVTVSDPIISNVTPAPEDKYQDDPTSPKGTLKQVDFSAPGATSVFSRKVYKEGKLVNDESFRSNFKPWQAVFLRGTAG